MNPLRDYLLDTYGFADRRFKNREADRAINIDDLNKHDVYPYCCSMMVRVPDSSKVTLILAIQYIPLTSEVRSLIEEQGGSIRELPGGHTAEITMNLRSVTFIRKLAREMRRAVGRGRRYADPNWKWICPRTSASLEKFADILTSYCSEKIKLTK